MKFQIGELILLHGRRYGLILSTYVDLTGIEPEDIYIIWWLDTNKVYDHTVIFVDANSMFQYPS